MVRSYNANITSCLENSWRPLPINGAESILVKTSFNKDDDPGVPQGVSVTISTSVWFPFQQVDMFNFLSNVQNRNKVTLENVNFRLMVYKRYSTSSSTLSSML